MLWIVAILLSMQAAAQEPVKPQISAAELVRQTVANEIAANNNPAVKHLFRSRKQTPRRR